MGQLNGRECDQKSSTLKLGISKMLESVTFAWTAFLNDMQVKSMRAQNLLYQGNLKIYHSEGGRVGLFSYIRQCRQMKWCATKFLKKYQLAEL